jgi:hypothetical protein
MFAKIPVCWAAGQSTTNSNRRVGYSLVSCRDHHDTGCPILVFFARVDSRDLYSPIPLPRNSTLIKVEVPAAHPFAEKRAMGHPPCQ